MFVLFGEMICFFSATNPIEEVDNDISVTAVSEDNGQQEQPNTVSLNYQFHQFA
jgi:hypothetical protein